MAWMSENFMNGNCRMGFKKRGVRRQQGSNLRGRSPTDFKSVSLTTRTYRLPGTRLAYNLYKSKHVINFLHEKINVSRIMGFIS